MRPSDRSSSGTEGSGPTVADRDRGGATGRGGLPAGNRPPARGCGRAIDHAGGGPGLGHGGGPGPPDHRRAMAVETGLAAVTERMMTLLPTARAAALADGPVTIDLYATDVEVYGRKIRSVAYNHQGQRAAWSSFDEETPASEEWVADQPARSCTARHARSRPGSAAVPPPTATPPGRARRQRRVRPLPGEQAGPPGLRHRPRQGLAHRDRDNRGRVQDVVKDRMDITGAR